MTATLSPDRANDARPMILTPVPDGSGGYRNEFRPAPVEKPSARKKRIAPDPIKANPDNAAQRLRQFIERLESLHAEKAGIADDIRDVEAEAKGTGFDTKTIRRILALRKVEKHVRMEDAALLETYLTSLGIDG